MFGEPPVFPASPSSSPGHLAQRRGREEDEVRKLTVLGPGSPRGTSRFLRVSSPCMKSVGIYTINGDVDKMTTK